MAQPVLILFAKRRSPYIVLNLIHYSMKSEQMEDKQWKKKQGTKFQKGQAESV